MVTPRGGKVVTQDYIDQESSDDEVIEISDSEDAEEIVEDEDIIEEDEYFHKRKDVRVGNEKFNKVYNKNIDEMTTKLSKYDEKTNEYKRQIDIIKLEAKAKCNVSNKDFDLYIRVIGTKQNKGAIVEVLEDIAETLERLQNIRDIKTILKDIDTVILILYENDKYK